MILQLRALLAKGEQPSRELQIDIARENQRLVQVALAINGKLPTHAQSGNGEYTHPLVTANLIRETAAVGGQPLDDAQTDALARIGADYERDWAQLQATYGSGTLELQKVLDELALKQQANERMRQVLNAAQVAALGDGDVQDVVMTDLLSPGLLLAGIAGPVTAPSRDALKAELVTTCKQLYGITDDEARAAGAAFDAWLAELGPLDPLPAPVASAFTVPQALVAGRAQLRAVQSFEHSVSDAARLKIRGNPVFVVPRVALPAPSTTTR
jgi:hypothetical protein